MYSKESKKKFPSKVSMKTIKEELFKWACRKHAANCFIDKHMLREKALELTRTHCFSGFKCSDKWLSQFLREHGFSDDQISQTGPLFDDYREWIDLMRPTIIKYKHKDLFHADELTMYSDMLPSGIENSEGNESPKNRITILMGCNSSGTTRLPLVICGPYPFKITAKEHVYCHSNDSSIGDKLYRNWVSGVNDRMARNNRKILLFLRRDRARALKDFVASNVQLVFLPENFPPLLRPLRRDVFHYVKMVFRRRFAERLKECASEWSLRDILASLVEAWETIPQELIIFSFQRTHFRSDDCFLQIECECWDSLKEGVPFKRFVTFDDSLSDGRVPYERGNRYYGYKLRANCKDIIQVNEDTSDSVKEDGEDIGRTIRELSSKCDQGLQPLKMRSRIDKGLGDIVMAGSQRSRNDKHRAGKRRIKEKAIEENSRQRKSQKRTYSETQFSTKGRGGNERAPKGGNIKNISTYEPADYNIGSSISMRGKKAFKDVERQKQQLEENDSRESLHAVIDKALSLLSSVKANYTKNLIDTTPAVNQQSSANPNNSTQLKRVTEVETFQQGDTESKCADQEAARLEGASSVTANLPESFFGKLSQPSTSTNDWNLLLQEIDESGSKETVEGHAFKAGVPSGASELDGGSCKDKSQSLNLAINSIDESSSSSAQQEGSEPRRKKLKTDQDWTKQYETTFVFGSPDANRSPDAQQEESIIDSYILNARPSPSPRD